VVVHGLGGIGKTQFVVRYLHEHRIQYSDGVFWLRADEETSLVGDLASLAWRLALPESEALGQRRQIEAVLSWLRAHQHWLLVLDNMEPTVQETARYWLPPGLRGHQIVTSRTPSVSASLGLEPLPLAVAARFLLDRTGQDDTHAAYAIAETLGRLPLALEQAAAYVLENDWRSLADYASLLASRMTDLLSEGKPDSYPQPIATTWDISLHRIEREWPMAVELLRLCAFLASDDVPVTALRSAAHKLPEGLREALEDEITCDRTLRTLQDYSLARRRGDGLHIHRLVQWVIRESLVSDERQRQLSHAMNWLAVTFPHNVWDPGSWRACARLLPHVHAVLASIGADMVEPESTSRLLDRVGTYLRARSEYRLARPILEQALRIRENHLGPENPDTAVSLDNLGLVLRYEGELGPARPLLERALAIRESTLGLDHPDTAHSLNSLALVLWGQGEVDAARLHCERALAIHEKVLGPRHVDTAFSLNNVGTLQLERNGNLEAGRLQLERSLAIRESVYGPDHTITAISLNNLGRLLHAQGNLGAASLLLERAFAIREKVLGAEHYDTAISLNSLGMLLRDKKEFVAARRLLERALILCEKVLGPTHPLTAVSRSNLALLLQDEVE
jgi:tetratricopeptide (TPR) repeat protein